MRKSIRIYYRLMGSTRLSLPTYSDSVYELRRLQHQHKPVSAFDSTCKHTLEELLERRRHVPDQQTTASAVAATTASGVSERVQHFSVIGGAEASMQELMPSSVRLEIRGLIEREYVRGVLNSAHAGEIDRTLREGLERRSRREQTRPSMRPTRQLFGRRSLRRQPENGQYPMPQRDQSSIVRQLQESTALGSLPPAERDRVLTEVNHLVQQQLVTSTLSGELRGILELHMQVSHAY